jgi:hypothetical protein
LSPEEWIDLVAGEQTGIGGCGRAVDVEDLQTGMTVIFSPLRMGNGS